MIFVTLSIIAVSYTALYLSDWMNVKRKGQYGNVLFFAGVLLNVMAAVFSVACFRGKIRNLTLTAVLLGAACISGAAMIVSLFFSLPKGTYTRPGEVRRVYCHKMYALCRHPGVFWYCVFLGTLFLAMPGREMAVLFALLCAGNVLYMLIQDVWSFPKLFSDYLDYKRTVPMFVPSRRSVKTCLEDYRNGSCQRKRGDTH